MKKKEALQALLGAKGLTVEELRSSNPALADEVLALVRSAEHGRLQDAIGDLPDDVRAKVAEIDFTKVTGNMAEHLRVKIVELAIAKEHAQQVISRTDKAKIGHELQPGQVIGTHPAVARQIAAARVHEVSTVAALDSAATEVITRAAPSVSALDDATLSRLVSERKLTSAQAKDVGFSAALFELVGEDTKLALAIRTHVFPQLGGPPRSTMDLARLRVADWTRFFASTLVALPPGVNPDSVSAALAGRFATIHPGVAIIARLPPADARQVTGAVNDLAPLFEHNAKVVGVDFAALATQGLTTSQIARLQTTHAQLVQLTTAYPGLELTTVIDDPRLTPATKGETVARRVGLVQKVSGQLGEFPMFLLDLSADSPDLARLGLAELRATAEEQRMVMSTLRTYQRAWAVAKNVDDAHTLVANGFTSAVSIGMQTFDRFQAKSGFAPAEARDTWDRARSKMAGVVLTTVAGIDLASGLQFGMSNQPPSAGEYLKTLPGFKDLFGSLSFCDCEECRSILGPAAYFVDLMRYIDENLRPLFAAHPDHPLDLKVRRPDLWTLELSCDNTTERVPTLDIINEILESYIAYRVPHSSADVASSAAIGSLVYARTLTQLVDSFTQPFHLPLSRIGSYLARLGHTRAEVANAVAASTTARAQAELGLSAPELNLVTTPDAVLAHMSRIYGVTFGGSPTAVTHVDAQELGPAMGLTRDELGQLVATLFVAAGGAHVTIHAAKTDPVKSVQNDVEWVSGLTADALDRMHRFTRMVRKVGWSIAELDLVLSTLGDTKLGAPGVDAIARLHAVQGRLGATVAELCALVGVIPLIPKDKSLFDRLFNPPSFKAADGAWPPVPPARPPHFIHPAFLQLRSSVPVDPPKALPRVLAGLSTDLAGLETLARRLAHHLAQDPLDDPNAVLADGLTKHNANKRYFVLSVSNLTLLYRHARLARLLQLSIDDLFQLLGFAGLDHIAGLADLLLLLDLHDWWRQSGYTLDGVAMAIGQPPRDPIHYPDPQTIAGQVVTSAATALTFTDTMFAVALGTTEQGSRDLLKSLKSNAPSVVESLVAGTWRLVAGVDLDDVTLTITIPTTATLPPPPSVTQPVYVAAAAVREALRPYLASEVLVHSLGTALGLATDKVIALAKLAGQSLTASTVVAAVRGDLPIDLDPLTALIAAVQRLGVMFSAPVWNTASISWAHLHSKLFGPDALPQMVVDAQPPKAPFVSLLQLRALSTYARVAKRRLAAIPNPVLPYALVPIANDLQGVLLAFDASGFPQEHDVAMARVLGVPVGLVVGLRGRVTLPVIAADALDQLDRAAQLATALGVDGDTLGALVSDDYDQLSHAADALGAALGARYTDEKTRAAKLEEAEQPIREAKRDALADYLIHSTTPKVWGTVDDLYKYFLIDVEAGGCSTTSRVVAATMSAQLYVYRAIMNLEQSASGDVRLQMPAGAAPEWEWRKNYRVWQANRKVFLWPENYLEPDLRDDKSPLFEELEQELLQTDISDQNVLNAYSKYLTSFEEIASLTIAGAYHDVRDTTPAKEESPPKAPAQVTDVLHLFGATAADPPIYYYRTCENLIANGRHVNIAAVWSPWQKITVQITGRKVSPVVHHGQLHVFWTDIRTRSNNKIENGSSTFAGYQHTMSLKFTTLRVDGTWTTPQEVQLPNNLDSKNFGPGRGQIMDPLSDGLAEFDPQGRRQEESIDDYTLSGPNWDWVWLSSSPSALEIQFRNFAEYASVDLFGRKIVSRSSLSLDGHSKVLCVKNTTLAADAATAVADAHDKAHDAAYWIEKARAPAAQAAKVDLAGDVAALNHANANYDSLARLQADLAVILAADAAAQVAKGKHDDATTAANKAAASVATSRGATAADRSLYSGGTTHESAFLPAAFANAVIGEDRLDIFQLDRPGTPPLYETKSSLQSGLYVEKIAQIPYETELLAVPGSEEDAILQVGNDVLLLQGSVTDNAKYVLRRLGTTLVENIARRLFEDGLDGLLDTQTQLALAEVELPFTRIGSRIVMKRFNGPRPVPDGTVDSLGLYQGKLDFTGPYGVYYRELFFHIPFLIANALNSRGRFESAQRWYHYIFDPTSSDTAEIDLTGLKLPEDIAHRLLDRVWRYREFRGLGIEHMRDLLTSKDAIALYEKDPFNPWAIARLRTSAFQKAIVMKYVDNLLDWADSLFTQFTMESVNEAMMLYIMASDILGARPAKLGDCGAGAEPITYADIASQLDQSSEFLAEIETWTLGALYSTEPSQDEERRTLKPTYTIDRTTVARAVQKTPLPNARISAPAAIAARATVSTANAPPPPPSSGMFRGLGSNQMRTASWGPALSNATTRSSDKLGGRRLDHARKGSYTDREAGYGVSVLRQQLAFCVPVNADLLAYWDRVVDRLYKIRNCMDIDGQKRELSLFAPPIDPMQLVAMKAAGLSLDDVLGGTSGNLPPYRFLYLIERAKAFATTLNGFGSALLSSLEKKDGEELNRLRLTQQTNLTKLTTQTRQLEIKAAAEALEALNRQLAGTQYRSEFYDGLITNGRNGWEVAESIARHTASIAHGAVPAIQLLAAMFALLPQIGSPFAMKFGGAELHAHMESFASNAGAIATIAESIAGSASLEANFARRSEGWINQKTVTDHEIKVLDRQIVAAQIHLDIANRALDLHQKSIDQTQELLELTDGKFTNHGLYTWMSTQLQRLYRDAYQNALAMTKLAEQAYRFERGDDTMPTLDMKYWDATHAGLLAGEQMLIDLQTLERRFIETNYRTPEIEQSFALSQIAPKALLDLRESGTCSWTVGEVFFDLTYPGHYKRRIRAVRLTVPCVTGPYTNVGATLNLTQSWIRPTPDLSATLVEVPLSRCVSIATSRAQNDAGVFELSFHDERYMPFEGAGAVSKWNLELPKSFRQFDYQTISDVVLTINYTAQDDPMLRQTTGTALKTAEDAIIAALTDSAKPLGRLFSLRQEFPMAYKGLLASPLGTPVNFDILDWHFPTFVTANGRTMTVTAAMVALKTAAGSAITGVTLVVDGETPGGFTEDLGGLPAADLGASSVFGSTVRGKHALVVSAAGGLAPTPPQVGDLSAIDGQKLLDVLLYVEYSVG